MVNLNCERFHYFSRYNVLGKLNSVLYLGIVKSFFAVLNTAKRKETLIDIHTHVYMQYISTFTYVAIIQKEKKKARNTNGGVFSVN